MEKSFWATLGVPSLEGRLLEESLHLLDVVLAVFLLTHAIALLLLQVGVGHEAHEVQQLREAAVTSGL